MAHRILSARTMNFDGLRSSGAETYDVDLSHGGRESSGKLRLAQGASARAKTAS
jgi:hypothetical protein